MATSGTCSGCCTAPASRERTPAPPPPRAPTVRRGAAALLLILSLLYALLSAPDLPYCASPSQVLCRQCPAHSVRCSARAFECAPGYVRGAAHCLATNLTESALRALHDSLRTAIARGAIATKYELFTSNYSAVHRRSDLAAAVLFGGEFRFGADADETILRVPPRARPAFAWAALALALSAALALIESRVYRRFARGGTAL